MLLSAIVATAVANAADANRRFATIIIRVDGMNLLDSMAYLWCNFMIFMFGVSIHIRTESHKYESEKMTKEREREGEKEEEKITLKNCLIKRNC